MRSQEPPPRSFRIAGGDGSSVPGRVSSTHTFYETSRKWTVFDTPEASLIKRSAQGFLGCAKIPTFFETLDFLVNFGLRSDRSDKATRNGKTLDGMANRLHIVAAGCVRHSICPQNCSWWYLASVRYRMRPCSRWNVQELVESPLTDSEQCGEEEGGRMSRATCLPQDPLARFGAIYEALNSERGWWNDASCLKFSAMTAVTCPGSPDSVASAIRDVANEIKDRSGWFGQLNSPLRFIMSAMLVMNEDRAEDFMNEVERTTTMFRAAGLRRGGIYEAMAVLILRLNSDLQPINSTSVIQRFQAIYEEMKKHHWWLTGPEEFPVCAMLVGQPESPEQIGERIEQIYQELSASGQSKGDPLQTAANLLCLSRLRPHEAATRFGDLATQFHDRGVSIWRSDYDELAILTFLNHSVEAIVDRVLRNRKEMEQLKPNPGRSLSFNLAASITFVELVQVDENLKRITDAKALVDMQAIINAQHAASAAAAS